MLVKGSKIRLVNKMGMFDNIGEVCEVINVENDTIWFKFGNGLHMGCMSTDEFDKYFEEVKIVMKKFNIGDHVYLIEPNKDLESISIRDEYVIDEIKYGVVYMHSVNDGEHRFITEDILNEYFAKTTVNDNERKRNFVDEVINHSSINVTKVFDKCTIVACKLPSGFVIVEDSSCIDPADYNEEIGFDICMCNIKSRIAEMEAYRIHHECWEEEPDCWEDDCECCEECECECECEECPWEDE